MGRQSLVFVISKLWPPKVDGVCVCVRVCVYFVMVG